MTDVDAETDNEAAGVPEAEVLQHLAWLEWFGVAAGLDDPRHRTAWKPMRWVRDGFVRVRCFRGHFATRRLADDAPPCARCGAGFHVSSPEDDDMTDPIAHATAYRSLRAAYGIVWRALCIAAERWREGHDLPRAALGALGAWLGENGTEDTRARGTVRDYWAELRSFEPKRPAELPGADETTRAVVVALTHAATIGCGLASLLPDAVPAPMIVSLVCRMLCGDAANVLVLTGHSPEDAWEEVMASYTAAGEVVPL